MDAVVGRILLQTPIWMVGILVLVLLLGMMGLGMAIRWRRDSRDPARADAGPFDGYIVSGALGLLALLLAFTFALAIDRFDTRRVLVVRESNAIGTTYLRAQLLDEPHRTRLSRLLEDYTEHRIAFATAETREAREVFAAQSNAYQKALWAETVAAVRPIRDLEIAQSFVETMNDTIDVAAERVAARRGNVPPRVLLALLTYMAAAAALLGYVMYASRRRTATALLLAMLSFSYLLIVDIDRPTAGAIREPQTPMEDLLAMIRDNPPASFDPQERASR